LQLKNEFSCASCVSWFPLVRVRPWFCQFGSFCLKKLSAFARLLFNSQIRVNWRNSRMKTQHSLTVGALLFSRRIKFPIQRTVRADAAELFFLIDEVIVVERIDLEPAFVNYV